MLRDGGMGVRRFGDDGGGAKFTRGRDKTVAGEVMAGNGNEEGAGLDLAGVGGDKGEVRVGSCRLQRII